MDAAIKTLESKLKELQDHRNRLRKSIRKKPKPGSEFFVEMFIRWRNESTVSISEIKKALIVLKKQN